MSNPNHFFDPEAGFSLVETMVVLAVALIGLLAVTNLMSHMGRETIRLGSKTEAVAVVSDVKRALSDSTTCLTNFGMLRIDDGLVMSDPAYKLTVSQLTEGASVLALVGQPVAGMTKQLRVDAIEAVNWTKPASDAYIFDLNIPVTYVPGGPFAPLKILRVSMQTNPASPPNAKVPVSCQASEIAAMACRIVSNQAPAYNQPAFATCSPGEVLMSGGGECLDANGSSNIGSAPLSQRGYIHKSGPAVVGGVTGWGVDCYGAENGVTGVNESLAKADAYCCR